MLNFVGASIALFSGKEAPVHPKAQTSDTMGRWERLAVKTSPALSLKRKRVFGG